MKVLHLIDHLALGGAQTHLIDLLEARSPDIDHAVLALGPRAVASFVDRIEAAGVPLAKLALWRWNPTGLLRLRARIAREKPDLLHTRLDFSNSLGVTAAGMLGRRRPRVLRTVDNDPNQHYRPWIRMVARGASRWVDAEITVSESVRAAAGRAWGGRVARVEVIPPGIDLDRFDASRVDPASVAALRAGVRRVVGTVGRLADQKGVGVLLDAMPALLAEEARTRLLVVGDGPCRRELEAQARGLGLAEAVSFLGFRGDVETAYAAMDAFVLPSRHEGFGIVFLEAMAMGVPVLGTRVVGSVDAVREGETGILVEPDDPRALSDALSRLLGEEALRMRLIENAREWVRRAGSRTAAVRRTEALYRDLARGPC